MWPSLLYWWAFTLGTFWFGACICIWPWQATQATRFDLTQPRRKAAISLIITLLQAVVFWVFITLASRGAPVLIDLVFLAAAINFGILTLARVATPREEDEWEELAWIGNSQFALWFVAGVTGLLLR